MAGGTMIGPRLVSFVPWTAEFPESVRLVGPAIGAAAFELPGPRQRPVRTWLEPNAGPAGIAGRIVDPDDTPRAMAVLLADGAADPPRVIALPTAPTAVAPRTDGVWSLDGDTLVAIGADGSVLARTTVAGARLFGVAADAVWVAGFGRCRLVGADGAAVTELPWSDPLGSCLVGDSLCGWDADNPGSLVVATPGGRLARRDPGLPREPFERPLAFAAGSTLAAALRTLVYRDGDGSRALALRGAGLTSRGEPFFAGSSAGTTRLWRAGVRIAEIPDEPLAQVLALADDRALLWSADTAGWTAAAAPSPLPAVDETGWRDEIFPHAWAVHPPYPFAIGQGGEALVASSGPAGIAVLGVRWPPTADD